MIIIKKNTKRAEAMLKNAMCNEGFRLFDVYGTVSRAKQNAWEHCYSLFCRESCACNFRIISHNTFAFSVAWDVLDSETGELLGTHIETSRNSYFVEA